MTIDESFDELYKLLRGSRCAAPLLQARTHFDCGEANQALSEIQKIRQIYIDTRKSLLEAEEMSELPNDPESQRNRKRQNKAADAVELFDELLSLLIIQSKKTTAIAPMVSSSLSKPSNPTPEERAAAQDEKDDADLRKELAFVTSEMDVRNCINRHCTLQNLKADHSFVPGERLVVFSNGMGHVVQVDDPSTQNESIRVMAWLDHKRMLPIPLEKFMKSATKGRVLKLVARERVAVTPAISEKKVETTDIVETEKLVSETADRDKILDMGAFSQLIDAAQRCGIVPGTGNIIQVRDCEFRLGKYNKALQMIETLYTSFLGAESQRNQRLQREESEIASGRKKMSPKEMQMKRVQDNQATQAIDRAKVRFQRVLEGLRGLLHLENSKAV